MKELSIEEKAKAYDKVRKKIALRFGSNVAEEIFSEFDESEDEMIRKTLISQYKGDGCICTNKYRIDFKDIRAWLEKQGEQTSLNNIWHKANETPQIKSDDRSVAVLLCCYRIFDVKPVESWEVAHYYHEYGFLNFGQTIKENDVIRWAYLDELIEKQGEPKEHDVCDNCDQQGSCVSPCCVKLVEKNGEQKSIVSGLYENKYGANYVKKPCNWSEEEERMLDEMYKFFDTQKIPSLKHTMDDYVKFIKSIKDRVIPQPKQEWSKEDDFMVENVRNSFGLHCGQMTDALKEQYDKFFNKVKSLRPQSQWEPSEDQIKALWKLMLYAPNLTVYTKIEKNIESLYSDLKKLKKE